MAKTAKIVVRVAPNHPTGSRSRAGFKFGFDPQLVEVTSEQLEAIKADKYLLIITKGTAYKQAIDSAKKNGSDVEGLDNDSDSSENNGSDENSGENGENGDENPDSDEETGKTGSESNDSDSDDKTQGEGQENGSDNTDSDEGSDEEEDKPLTIPQIKEELTKNGVEFKSRDNRETLEELLRTTLVEKLKAAEEDFSEDADIKDLIALAAAE